MARKTWMKAVVKAAKEDKTEMPWARGARRALMIARRKEDERKSA